jgi:hypothetical protein
VQGGQKDVGGFSEATIHSGEKYDMKREQRNIMTCISNTPLLNTVLGVREFSN